MAAPEFDEFSDDYATRLDQCVRVTGQDADYFAAVKADVLLAEMRHLGVDPATATVLDFGCGTGSNAIHLESHVGHLIGTDVSGGSLLPARANVPGASFLHTDDLQLPLCDGAVDVVLISCVLHHIPLDVRAAVINELHRVLSDRGFVFIVEHNPYNPATRWIVSRCEFDEDAVLLTARTSIELLASGDFEVQRRRYILFIPGTGRLINMVNRSLHWLPLGAQYSVSARPKRR